MFTAGEKTKARFELNVWKKMKTYEKVFEKFKRASKEEKEMQFVTLIVFHYNCVI